MTPSSRFTVEEYPPANYAAISANVAIAGINGGHEKYALFLKYGSPPTPAKYDYRSTVTASDSYVGDKLFSHDIRIEAPRPGYVKLRTLLVVSWLGFKQRWSSYVKLSVISFSSSIITYVFGL